MPFALYSKFYFGLCFSDPAGWWTGKRHGKQGLFPANYVEKI